MEVSYLVLVAICSFSIAWITQTSLEYFYCRCNTNFTDVLMIFNFILSFSIALSLRSSIGCIFGELLRKEAMLQGRGELDQIDLIFKLLSVPDDETWPGFTKLPNTGLFRWKNKEGSKLKETFPINSFSGEQTYLDPNGFDLLSKLLTMNPKRRISAQDALNHRYFKEGVEMQTPQFSF